MKVLFLSFLFSFNLFADVCVCQFPKEDARFGGGYRGEIGFYKAGCAVWLAGIICRKSKIVDINKDLEEFLTKVHRDNEPIKIGFVGHWSSSEETIDYLKSTIEPLNQKFQSPILVENTACSVMDEANDVQAYLESLRLPEQAYISVSGSQTTSIGMWDKVSIGFRRADLMALADSRGIQSIYPKCEINHKRRCTGFQEGEKGSCIDSNGEKQTLICYSNLKKNSRNDVKVKNAKRWLYLDEAKELLNEYIIQTNEKIGGLKRMLK